MQPRTLSREEEAELARSNKKVKDYHHAEFNVGSRESSPAPGQQNTGSFAKASFKEKLVGEMPGAYVNAFDFESLMEEDEFSDGEGSESNSRIPEGWVTVKLTKETKRRIRGPLSKAIIVKLVGRTISLTYMRTKLNQMWRPSTRMDCVDLGYGFFLVRFFAKEDLDNVLRRGPWFLGDHFLSIRPWEPFFKPSTANVSLIAVWIRLCELPFELYEAEVLKQIGESIGKVLRIDSHTAMEARGKYARLCIQIDINKPLVNTILIGRFEQAVTYEGIQSLCFSCGRLGHKVEACPYTIRKGKEQVVSEEEVLAGRDATSREMYDSHSVTVNRERTEVREDTEVDGQYGPWMVVSRRTNGRKGTKPNFSTERTGISGRAGAAQLPPKNPDWRGTSSNSIDHSQSMLRRGSLYGAGDHTKRTEAFWSPKNSGLGLIDQIDNSKMDPTGSSLLAKETGDFHSGIGPSKSLKSQAQAPKKHPFSVKGKKALARGVHPPSHITSNGNIGEKFSNAKLAAPSPSHAYTRSRELSAGLDPSFRFTALSCESFEQKSNWIDPPGDRQAGAVCSGALITNCEDVEPFNPVPLIIV